MSEHPSKTADEGKTDIGGGPQIVTFGCRLNTYESEVMRGHARAAGLEDAVIINTCAVTGEAVRQARQAIRKARRERPAARIIVTGCAAQIDPQKFAQMAEVDHVIGNDIKMQAQTYQKLDGQRVVLSDISIVRETAGHLVQNFAGMERAFVQVQNGCNHRCTFCVIPFGRGPSRSVPPAQVVAQVREVCQAGYNEIALTGVDITSYGEDAAGDGLSLGALIRRVLRDVPEVPRLRLSSLDPKEIDADLWDLLANEPRLMPHLHLSLQAGADMILKRMKRRHRVVDVRALCAKARQLRPEIVFGADLIAGFPTEDDALAAETLALVEELDLTWLHVFPYSARSGTPAARMPPVPVDLRRRRAAALREAGKRAAQRYVGSLIGTETTVLVERDGLGRTPGFAEVKLAFEAKVGSIIRVRLIGQEGPLALAEAI